MDFRQLEAFCLIAAEKNFHKAAEALHISQPAISSRINQLETQLRVSLFERNGKQIGLTKFGESLLPFAEKILDLTKEAEEYLGHMHNQERSYLDIGTTSRIVTYILPQLLERFQQSYPNVQIKIRTSSTEELIEMLTQNRIQLGLINTEVFEQGFTATPLLHDAIILVTSPEHPLYLEYMANKKISLERLKQYRVINFNQTTTYYRPIFEMLQQRDILPRSFISVDNIEAMKQMTIRRLGIAFLPRMAVQRELRVGELAEIPFQGQVPLMRTTFLVYKTTPYQNPVIKQFESIARQVQSEESEFNVLTRLEP